MVINGFEVDSESGGACDQPVRPAIARLALSVSLSDRLLDVRACKPALVEPQLGVCSPDEVLDCHLARFYGRGRRATVGLSEREKAGAQ